MARSKPTGSTRSTSNHQDTTIKPASTDIEAPKSSRQQQSISRLLAASQQKRPALNSPDTSLSPNSKRRKLENVDVHEPCSPLPKMASVENMYSFESPQKNGTNGTIDLTKSPSPRVRRVSNANFMNNTTPQNGAKKLVVKNLRTTKSDPSKYCDRMTQNLDEALTRVFKSQRPDLSNEELYKGVENLCKLGKAVETTKMLWDRCEQHILHDFKPPLEDIATSKPVDVLKAVVVTWARWMKQVYTIRAIFFFLDRSHLLQASSPSIYEKLTSQFRQHIFDDNSLQGKIIDGTYDLLQADRTRQEPDPALLQEAVKILHDLAVYTSHLEPKILTVSQNYIATWSDTECEAKNLPEFVDASLALIQSEMDRCDEVGMKSTTRAGLLTLLEHHLIERREADLTKEKSVAELLDHNSTENLEHLYSLLQRRRMGSKLRGPFGKWIDETGSGIVFDEKEQDQMVPKLLALKQKLDHTWRFAFHKDDAIASTLRESFEGFINKSKKTTATWNTDNSKPGEMIAKYVDQLLRAGAKAIPVNLTASATKSAGVTPGLGKPETLSPKPVKAVQSRDEDDEDEGLDEDTEVNNQLDQVLDLFRFVHGKAVFEAFYKKDLARRLLMGRSASNDAERSMLTRLKTECGSGFTQNLEQMFKDQELAREEMSAYKLRLEQQERRMPVDLNVNILSASAWPTYPDVPCVIPPEIKQAIDKFEQYYHSKHTGRKLYWKHALAHCQLKASFPAGKKEIVVSSFQAIVMLLFNGVGLDEHLTYERIKAESGLSDAELERTLQSLACAKLRPLTKHPKGRDVSPTDTFTLNPSFSHPKYRLKINSIQLKETAQENKATHERVAADRAYETQAAIVRIMKARKRIRHQELVAETIKATRSRGVLQPAEIKRQVDRLIDKEYLERVEGGWYEYLA